MFTYSKPSSSSSHREATASEGMRQSFPWEGGSLGGPLPFSSSAGVEPARGQGLGGAKRLGAPRGGVPPPTPRRGRGSTPEEE